jgi:YD repeat-containing protein
MKTLWLALFLFLAYTAPAQYYYKDIVGTRETAQMIAAYKNNKVTRVVVNSYDANNTRTEDFFVEQVFAPQTNMLRTTSRSAGQAASTLFSIADADSRVVKTIDSTENMVSTTTYTYDANGQLQHMLSNSKDTANKLNETEEHIWQYQNGQVYQMLRIINKLDTTYVHFKLDERGNIIEEQSIRRSKKADPVYYYYDATNRLTDIVRYNTKAKRLLPEYMFEYSPANQVIQKITVPSNSSDYLIWRYQYDANGLKIREAIYDKYKALNGKIEYQYVRG